MFVWLLDQSVPASVLSAALSGVADDVLAFGQGWLVTIIGLAGGFALFRFAVARVREAIQ